MLLGLVRVWQVGSVPPACEGSICSILITCHLSPNYQGGSYSSLITVSSLVSVTGCLGSHANLVCDYALPGWAWGLLFVRFVERKETAVLGRTKHGTPVT